LVGEAFVSDHETIRRQRLIAPHFNGGAFLAAKRANAVIRSCRAPWSVLEAVFDYAGTGPASGLFERSIYFGVIVASRRLSSLFSFATLSAILAYPTSFA
jgi:hypothetical protein